MIQTWWQRIAERGRGRWWPIHHRTDDGSWWTFRGRHYGVKDS